MKKPSFKYDIKFESVGKTKLGGKIGDRMIVETVTGLNLKGIKEALKECLDLAIKPDGEPYRPTVDDIKKSMGSFYDSEKWLKKQTKIYQQAYDLYDDIMTVLKLIDAPDRPYDVFRDFKPFGMQIDIKVY